jgi:hypothetical protein
MQPRIPPRLDDDRSCNITADEKACRQRPGLKFNAVGFKPVGFFGPPFQPYVLL